MAHDVLMITTGGTIAGHVALDQDDTNFIRTRECLMADMGPTAEKLAEKCGTDVNIKVHDLCNVDSSDIVPTHWTDIAELIKRKYDDYSAFIITHGTNTLGYTCAALSFAIANSSKPIILTGSQVPVGLLGTDGLTNLQNALRLATWQRRSNNPIRGVLAVFGSHIIAGSRVKKDTEFDYDAFKSFSTESIGRVGRIININEAYLQKHLSYLQSNSRPIANRAADLCVEADFDERIVSLTEFPGMSSGLFKTLVERHDIQGFMLRAFGAGDASHRLHGAFEYLRRKEIPIVISTQSPNGNANFQVNEPGQIIMERALAIPAYDMSIEAQTAKLMWLLAKKAEGLLGYNDLRAKMIEDMRGEINVLWECDYE